MVHNADMVHNALCTITMHVRWLLAGKRMVAELRTSADPEIYFGAKPCSTIESLKSRDEARIVLRAHSRIEGEARSEKKQLGEGL